MSIWYWLLLVQVKHFIADYPLQGKYMLGKFKEKGWVLPLAVHAGVHALFTLGIALAINPTRWWVCLLDFVAHFIMDRVKASPNYMGRWKALSANEMKSIIKEEVELVVIRTDFDREAARSRAVTIKHNTWFWWALGFDQLVHHVCDILILWTLFAEGTAQVVLRIF